MELCGYPQKCWDHHFRACVRPKGHVDNGNPNCHNPFSDSPPPKMDVVTIRKPARRVEIEELVSA